MAFNVQRALQDGYSQEEIDRYLKEKGLAPDGSPAPKSNVLAELGKFFIKPAVEGIKMAELIGAGVSGDLDNPERLTRQQNLPGPLKNLMYSPEEIDKKFGGDTTGERLKNTFETSLKTSAGVGSYFVPAGGAVKGAPAAVKTIAPNLLERVAPQFLKTAINKATFGATEGFLRGVSEEDATPESVVTSTATSGLASGAFSVASDAAKGFFNFVGEKVPEGIANRVLLRKSLAETEKDISREWASEFKRISGESGEEYKRLGAQIVKEGGLKGSVKKIYFKAQEEKQNIWNKEIAPLIAQHGDDPIPVSTIKAPLMELKDSFEKGFRDEEASSAITAVLDDLDRMAGKEGNLTVKVLQEVKQKEDKIFETIYSKGKNFEELPINKRVTLEALSVIRETIEQKIPAIKSPNIRYGMWSGAQQSLVGIAAQGARRSFDNVPISIPLLMLSAAGVSGASGNEGLAGGLASLAGIVLLGKAIQSPTTPLTMALISQKLGKAGGELVENKVGQTVGQKGVRNLSEFIFGQGEK